jgi:type IV secretion system protein VirD4
VGGVVVFDWMKGLDPLKGVELFGEGSGKSTREGFSTGLRLGSLVTKAFASSRARKRMEKAGREERERLEHLAANPPPLHGSARWASTAEVSGAGLLRDAFDGPSALLLGAFADPAQGDAITDQIYWDGEGHLLTVAPTRSGKSTTMIIPNLVRYQGSCVVLDPKGELYRDTAAWRREHVGPVYRIAPFLPETDGFNPLESLTGFADAKALADLLMPVDPKAQDFFRKDAIAILTAMVVYVARHAPPGKRTLAEIRNLTAGPLTRLGGFLEVMASSPDRAIANAAGIVLGKNRDRGLPSLRDTLNTELSLWDDPGVVRATSRTTVDFRSLKDRPATVYITVPFDKTDAYAAFLKIALTTALEAMLQNPGDPDIPVLFVLDEFLALGPFPKFRDAIRTHASAGVRLWFFVQDVPTLEHLYGATGWKPFLNTSVKTFFGTDEPYTGQLIRDFVGDATQAYLTTSLNTQEQMPHGRFPDARGSSSSTVSRQVQFSARPLLSPTEAVSLLSGPLSDKTRYGLMFVRGCNPVKLRLVPWFLGGKVPRRVGPSPTDPPKPGNNREEDGHG